jgi:O-antigen ligase
LSNGAELSLVFEDVKPLSYFLMILFFSITIDSQQNIELVVKTVKVCSVVLMIVYLSILIGIYIKIIDFNSFYALMSTNNEFIFRPDIGFFYSGFLYLCVGCLFFLFSSKWSSKIIAALLMFSIVLTFTRGFILSTAATIVVYIVFFSNKNLRMLCYIASLIAVIVLFTPWFITQLGDKSDSNIVRLITYEQVKESVTPLSVLFGHGLGIGVEMRSVHMEATYLEIFHKQGLLGLFFWFIILLLTILAYSKIRNKESRLIALPFVLSTVLIYIQTTTNPFLNNPIGMSMVLIAFSALRALGDKKGTRYVRMVC